MSVLLFGSTGMLGNYVYRVIKNSNLKVKTVSKRDFDVLVNSREDLRVIVDKSKCDVIVNCVGLIPQSRSKSLKEFHLINTLFPLNLNEVANEFNKKFIHISTNCVFNIYGNYNELSFANSDELYGISKNLGEPMGASTIRTSIIGEEKFNKRGLMEWIKSNKNKEINGFVNHFWNGVTCLTLANIILNIIQTKNYWSGIRHIHSPNIISKFELLHLINEIYSLNIRVLPTVTDIKDQTLTSNYKFNYVENIRSQIITQKQFGLLQVGNFSNCIKCRFCGNFNLIPVYHFGLIPLVGSFFSNKMDVLDEMNYPLTFMYCETCKTGLIKEVINRDSLFTNIHGNGYFYYSSNITILREHFTELSNVIKKLNPSSILEIGCNDGVLLKNFTDIKCIGVDPSETINKIKQDNITIFKSFFDDKLTDYLIEKHGKQDIIVSCNCLAHIDNELGIYRNIKRLLGENGTAIIEVHNLKNVLTDLNFDFIYHEHNSFYSVGTFKYLCDKFDFQLIDVNYINTHGGSIRVFLKHQKNNFADNVNLNVIEEQSFKSALIPFSNSVNSWKLKMTTLLTKYSPLVGYGASGRSNMILSFLDIPFDIIIDDSEHKKGKMIPRFYNIIQGKDFDISHLKIIWILAWPYTKSIITKHTNWILNGGIFVKILPEIVFIDKSNYFLFT